MESMDDLLWTETGDLLREHILHKNFRTRGEGPLRDRILAMEVTTNMIRDTPIGDRIKSPREMDSDLQHAA